MDVDTDDSAAHVGNASCKAEQARVAGAGIWKLGCVPGKQRRDGFFALAHVLGEQLGALDRQEVCARLPCDRPPCSTIKRRRVSAGAGRATVARNVLNILHVLTLAATPSMLVEVLKAEQLTQQGFGAAGRPKQQHAAGRPGPEALQGLRVPLRPLDRFLRDVGHAYVVVRMQIAHPVARLYVTA